MEAEEEGEKRVREEEEGFNRQGRVKTGNYRGPTEVKICKKEGK